MNSKAIKRQLLAAIAMVLVAAIALGSSTYAWFVASGTVTATGMKVQATSEGGLAISHGGEAWGTTADGGIANAKNLKPASTADFTKWSTATAADPSKKDADSTTRKEITVTLDKGDTVTDNGYVIARKFLIRSSNPSILAEGLNVSDITIDSSKKGADGKPIYTMSTALRVGLAFTNLPGETKTKNMIFAPVEVSSDTADTANKPTTSYTFYKDSSDTNGTTVTPIVLNKTDGNVVVPADVEIPNGTSSAIEVIVYVWIEGEDNNLYSDNYHAEDLSVTVEFTSPSLTNKSST